MTVWRDPLGWGTEQSNLENTTHLACMCEGTITLKGIVPFQVQYSLVPGGIGQSWGAAANDSHLLPVPSGVVQERVSQVANLVSKYAKTGQKMPCLAQSCSVARYRMPPAQAIPTNVHQVQSESTNT